MKIPARASAIGLAGMLAILPAAAEPLTVEANKTVTLRLQGAAASVVLGNRNIADVAVHDEHLIFVTGKSFGTTNLMVFDQAGRQIYSSDLVVTANSTNLVTVNRSGSNYTYDCAPTCRSVLSPGDDNSYFNTLIGQQRSAQRMAEAD